MAVISRMCLVICTMVCMGMSIESSVMNINGNEIIGEPNPNDNFIRRLIFWSGYDRDNSDSSAHRGGSSDSSSDGKRRRGSDSSDSSNRRRSRRSGSSSSNDNKYGNKNVGYGHGHDYNNDKNDGKRSDYYDYDLDVDKYGKYDGKRGNRGSSDSNRRKRSVSKSMSDSSSSGRRNKRDSSSEGRDDSSSSDGKGFLSKLWKKFTRKGSDSSSGDDSSSSGRSGRGISSSSDNDRKRMDGGRGYGRDGKRDYDSNDKRDKDRKRGDNRDGKRDDKRGKDDNDRDDVIDTDTMETLTETETETYTGDDEDDDTTYYTDTETDTTFDDDDDVMDDQLFELRLNAGGLGTDEDCFDYSYIDIDRFEWLHDCIFQPDEQTEIFKVDDDIDRTQDPEIFQSERFVRDKNLLYVFGDIPNGKYLVRLSFSENFFSTRNERVFDVAIQDEIVLDDFDIFDRTQGKNVALIEEFETNVFNNVLTLEFIKNINDPKINGIEIYQLE